MARKLKTYQASVGFFDLAIAAPSMKAALEAWGSNSNLFHQGVAKQVDDPKVVAAAMSKPGVILRRPVGSNGPFKEHAQLPTDLSREEVKSSPGKHRAKLARAASPEADDKPARQAALAFKREQRRREGERRKEEAARAKHRERQQQAITKALAALDKANREHEATANAIQSERVAVERRSEAEATRWKKQKEKLESALRRARD
jgi:hypothetical protein